MDVLSGQRSCVLAESYDKFTAYTVIRRSNLNEHSMPEQKRQDLLHLFRLIGKPAVQAIVNYVSFYHTSPHKIQRRTNVPAIRKSEQYKRNRPETTLRASKRRPLAIWSS